MSLYDRANVQNQIYDRLQLPEVLVDAAITCIQLSVFPESDFFSQQFRLLDYNKRDELQQRFMQKIQSAQKGEQPKAKKDPKMSMKSTQLNLSQVLDDVTGFDIL